MLAEAFGGVMGRVLFSSDVRLAGLVCSLLMPLTHSVSTAAAQTQSPLEAPIRTLFEETKRLIAYTDQEMRAMSDELVSLGKENTATQRRNDYASHKAKIIELEKEIGLSKNWEKTLPIGLAKATRKMVAGFAWTDKERLDQKRFALDGSQKAACLKVHSDLEPTVTAINEALGSNRLYSKEARAAVAPYRPAIDAKFRAYEAETKLNVEAYYAGADDLNRRRGEVARRIWRFAHTYEDAGLEGPEKEMRATLLESLGMSREAYLNPVQAAMHFSAFISSRDCPYKLRTLTQYESNAVLPKSVAQVAHRISEPVATFDEQENFLERPSFPGGSQLERVAAGLSHRQLQRLRLRGAMATVAEELKVENAAYAEIAKIDSQLGFAVEGHKKAATPFIPEAELQDSVAMLDRELTDVEAGLERALEDIRAEREAQREAARQARLALFIQTGQDANGIETYRPAKDGEAGRSVTEILAPFDRRRAQHVKARSDAQKELDPLRTQLRLDKISDPTAFLKRYKAVKAKIDGAQALIDQADRRIARVKSLKVESDFDETVLNALLDTYAVLEASKKDLEDRKAEAQQDVLAARSSSLDREKLYDFGNRLSVGLSNVKALDPALAKQVDALKPAAERLTRDRRNPRAATEILADMTALAEGVAPLRAALTSKLAEHQAKMLSLRTQATGLGQKLDLVTGTLLSLKRAATLILQRELPTAGIPESDDIYTQLTNYKGALDKIQSHLDESAKLIKEKTASAQEHYDKLEGFLSKGQKDSAKRAIAGAKWINGYVEEISEATALLGQATDKAAEVVQVYNNLAPPPDNSPASAFRHINGILTESEKLFAYVPVVGVLGEQYFGYLNYTVGQIEKNATAIKDATVRKLTASKGPNTCLFRTPERHLYTMAELEASPAMDVSIMTKWYGWGGRSEQIGIQARRVIALMGARNVSIACEQPAQCERKARCSQQGRIGWRGK